MGRNKFSEDQLRSLGFTQGADGSWSKAPHGDPHPSGRPDPQPSRAEQPPAEEVSDTQPVASRVLVIATVRTVRPRDYDGLGAACKYYIDSLIHIGLIRDDSPEHVEVIYCQAACKSFAEEETILEVWEIPDEETIVTE